MRSSTITIKDIARELGISPSTVSRALKDHPDISTKTKKLVNDLATKLNYEPNSIATSLRSQKTNTIGVIVPEIIHFFFSTVISGIEEVAYDAGYTVMFCQSNESYEKELIDTKALMAHRVDGLLVSFSKETLNFDHFLDVQKKNVPIVFFDRIPDGVNASLVLVDDYNGAVNAVQHLINIGRKKIAHLAGPQNLTISKNRYRGYNDTLKKHNISSPKEYIKICGRGDLQEGIDTTTELLNLPNPPDAVFANNDMAAYGAMQAIKKMGLKIPHDIAIVGFSNWQFSSLTEPQLTTVSQPGIDIGKAAARRLIFELGHKNDNLKPVTEVLKTDLIIRNSTQSQE